MYMEVVLDMTDFVFDRLSRLPIVAHRMLQTEADHRDFWRFFRCIAMISLRDLKDEELFSNYNFVGRSP